MTRFGDRSAFCRMETDEDFEHWEKTPPPDLCGDIIWRLPAYRLSRFLALKVRDDADRVRRRSPRTAEQLEHSVHSIGINITEGYGRLHGRERARFYEFALGSAREARDWYARCDRYLDYEEILRRARLLTRTMRILSAVIPRERAGSSERRIEEGGEKSLRRRSQPPKPSDDETSRSDNSSQ